MAEYLSYFGKKNKQQQQQKIIIKYDNVFPLLEFRLALVISMQNLNLSENEAPKWFYPFVKM